jgi:hypothetical protein
MLNGYKAGGELERASGRHWLWNVFYDIESPGFESNDLGRLMGADGFRLNSTLEYRETVPGRIFRNYSLGVTQSNDWNHGGNRQRGDTRANVTLTFLNFWTTTIQTGPDYRLLSSTLTRGGPLMASPGGWTTSLSLRNRSAAQTTWNGRLRLISDEGGGESFDVSGGISFRPGPQWQFSATPAYVRQTDSQQYVATLAGGRPETYGRRYIFSFIDRSTLSTQFRLGYTIKPDVNIDVYAEPFASSGRYYDFGELSVPRSRDLLVYGAGGTSVALLPDGQRTVSSGGTSFTLRNFDFNNRSFRSNVVLRWEWRPGSLLYVVWQQDREAREALGARAGFDDMFGSLGAPGNNYFVIKTSFWLPIR